jgi:hypothetical protein
VEEKREGIEKKGRQMKGTFFGHIAILKEIY